MNRSPLHDFHIAHGAKMVDFAGWEMPIYYTGINEEHIHTRTKMSVFDVSHMGRLRVEGDDALPFLEMICTRNLGGTQVGQSKYTHICNESGGIIDDVIVSRHDDHWMVVCNASNRAAVTNWLTGHSESRSVTVIDETVDTAMIAVQGPAAVAFVEDSLKVKLSEIKRYWFIDGDFMGMKYSIYRSGYTGEDGIEAIVPAGAVGLVMPLLCGSEPDAGRPCKPAGLGARDTLRTEAGMPLYGHELRDDLDSLTAGQGWCVDLDKEFIGAAAMRSIKENGLVRKMAGLVLEGKRIARFGYRILKGGGEVGEITSGTMSPTLGKSIAMGFLDVGLAELGTEVSIDLGRKENLATVVKLPFYKRSKP